MFQLYRAHLNGYQKSAILAPLCITLEVICELLLPLIMAEIVDVALPAGNLIYILQMGGLMIALTLLAMGCGVSSARFAAAASQGFGANLRQSLFAKIQQFSFGDIDKFSSASLVTRLTNDVNAMTTMLSMSLRMLVRAPVMLAVALVVTISLNMSLATIILIMIPVLVAGIALLLATCFKLFRINQQRIDALNNTVQENLVAARVVKAFVRQPHEEAKFKVSNDNLTAASLAVGMRMVTMMPFMAACLNVATVAVLYLGGRMVMEGTFLVGSLSAFFTYISLVLMSVMMMGMSLVQFSRAQACASRIQEVLDAVPSIQDGDTHHALPVPKGALTFDHVSFRYKTDGQGDDVLNHIHFHVEGGKFVAIVGGTGTGKSSLVNLIPRFYDVTSGSVAVDGLDVRQYPIESLRQRIGMVLQTNLLFSGTVRENLLWGDETASDEDLWQAAEDAQAAEFIRSLPQGMDTPLSQGGVNLSGGQKQRLCIARAMVKKPAILILDDSTSAVDSTTEAAIRESFRSHLSSTTILMIAQRISSVQYADEILVLDDGVIVGQGTHETLLESNQIYREIYQSQLEGVAQ